MLTQDLSCLSFPIFQQQMLHKSSTEDNVRVSLDVSFQVFYLGWFLTSQAAFTCFSWEPNASSHFHESSSVLPSHGVTQSLLAIKHHYCKYLSSILALVLVLVLDYICTVVLNHPSASLLQPKIPLHSSENQLYVSSS